jgi:predicted DNA-binding protein with PD1-like motif
VDKLRYRECQQSRRFIITVPPGAKLVEELRRFAGAVGLKMAAMVSAVGSIRNLTFTDIQMGAHLPITEPRLRHHQVEGPLGLLGIEGNLVAGEKGEVAAHLHIIAAKSSGEVIGGGLAEAEVFASCEIVLTEYVVEGVERHHSTVSGVDTLTFRET